MSLILRNYKLFLFIATVLAILAYVILMNIVRIGIAYYLGDTSVKKYLKNPLKLVEPVGFIFLYIFNLGWCQDINFNSSAFKDRKKALLIINATPIILGLLLGLLLAFVPFNTLSLVGVFMRVFTIICFKNSIFNMLPIRPLFGEKVFRAIGNPNTVFKISQNEKVLQILMVFLLLFGIASYVIDFIWKVVFL